MAAITAPDELRIATRRHDGTDRDPVTIWHVRVGDDLYVRSVNGPSAAWFRGVLTCHQARISAGAVEREVSLIDSDDELDDKIDAAYRSKYGRYSESTLRRITSPEARSTTLKLVPINLSE